jgi:SAM-dependent methyltransferase
MIKKNGFSKRLQTHLDDMSSMPFKKKSFDIIWCEGSINYLGFEKGIKEFKKFLKHNGMIVVADYALKMDRKNNKFPQELKEYLEGFYPSIDIHENNIFSAENYNYKLIATFQVQEEAWHENYLSIIKEQCDKIESENEPSIEIKKVLKEMMLDSNMHEKYNKYYSYYFYIFQNIK